MQPGVSRDALLARRTRVLCPQCRLPIELSGLRRHLREVHQVGSAALESALVAARLEARRTGRTRLH